MAIKQLISPYGFTDGLVGWVITDGLGALSGTIPGQQGRTRSRGLGFAMRLVRTGLMPILTLLVLR